MCSVTVAQHLRIFIGLLLHNFRYHRHGVKNDKEKYVAGRHHQHHSCRQQHIDANHDGQHVAAVLVHTRQIHHHNRACLFGHVGSHGAHQSIEHQRPIIEHAAPFNDCTRTLAVFAGDGMVSGGRRLIATMNFADVVADLEQCTQIAQQIVFCCHLQHK